MDDFVGGVTFYNHVINTFGEMILEIQTQGSWLRPKTHGPEGQLCPKLGHNKTRHSRRPGNVVVLVHPDGSDIVSQNVSIHLFWQVNSPTKSSTQHFNV